MEANKRPYVYHSLIACLGLIVWSQALFAPYQFDDYVTPLQDPASQSLVSFFENFFRTLRPLTKFTYAIESSLGLTEAFQRRFFQFVLMVISSSLIFELLKRRTCNLLVAALLSLLWVTHPMHAETFVSLSGRSTLLAICFILASLYEKRIGLSLTYALLATLSKEVAIPFFLYQCFQFARVRGKNIWYVMFPILLMTVGLLRDRLWKLIQFSWNEAPYYTHWWDGVAAFSAELLYVVMPWRLSVDPDFLFLQSSLWFFISLMLVLVLVYLGKKTTDHNIKRDLLLWFLLALPAHSIVLKLDPLALRSLSFVSVVFPFLLVNMLKPHKGVMAILLIALGVSIASTVTFSRTYREPVELWRHAYEKAPHKMRPVVNYSYFLVRQDRLNEAKTVLQTGLDKWPHKIILRQRLEAVETLIENQKLMEEGTEQ